MNPPPAADATPSHPRFDFETAARDFADDLRAYKEPHPDGPALTHALDSLTSAVADLLDLLVTDNGGKAGIADTYAALFAIAQRLPGAPGYSGDPRRYAYEVLDFRSVA